MSQPIHCEVCTHSQRAVIDAALAAGGVPHELSGQYGLPFKALSQHKRICLGQGRPPRSTRPRGERTA